MSQGLDTNRFGYLILYALLHDIGKPILRYIIRVNRKYEDEDPVLTSFLSELGYSSYSVITNHDIISDKLINWIAKKLELPALDKTIKNEILELVKISDRASALERGISYGRGISYKEIWGLLSRIYRDAIKKNSIEYEYYTAPYLSPFWWISLTSYDERIGVCKKPEEKTHSKISEEFFSSKYVRGLKLIYEGKIDEGFNKVRDTIGEIVSRKFWIPVKPLNFDTIVDLKTMDIEKAMEGTRYASVFKQFYTLLNNLINTYKALGLSTHGISRGFLNTLDHILFSTTSLVPSAVYATPAPDISLYAHSKTVAALAQIYPKYRKCRLLVVGINNIQQFLSSIVVERAASRLLRGKSLLVELIQDDITSLVLEAFGGLTISNVITKEGGNVSVLIPDTGKDDLKIRIDKIKSHIYGELSESFNAKLWATISLSEPMDPKRIGEIFTKEAGDLRKAVLELNHYNGVYRAQAFNELNRYYKEGKIKDIDPLTNDPIFDREEYKICVMDDTMDYADKLAPGKLSVGECLSQGTHYSLVAGGLARNLFAIISFRIYSQDQKTKGYYPYEEAVKGLANVILNTLTSSRLLGGISLNNTKYRYGIIIFPKLGSIHLLISVISKEALCSIKDYEKHYSVIKSLFDLLNTKLKSYIKGIIENEPFKKKFVLEFKLINNVEDFIINDEELIFKIKDIVKEFINMKDKITIDIEFKPYILNTYHPIKHEREKLELKSLDEMKLVGIAKLDGDLIGEILELYSQTLNRIIDFSNMLYIGFNMKAYMSLLKETCERNRYKNVIILYSGGDDTTIYGEWREVLEFCGIVYREITKKLLNPLSASIGVSIGKPKTPLLHLYLRAIEQLDFSKYNGRRMFSMDLLEVLLNTKCGKYVRNSIPLECRYTDLCYDKHVLSLFENIGILRDKPVDRTLVYNFGELGHMAIESIEAKDAKNKILVAVYYAYLWARREEKLDNLSKILKELCGYQLDKNKKITSIDNIVYELAKVKPLFDIINLVIRTYL